MSPTTEACTEIHYDPDCSREQLVQVLSALDRSSHITGDQAAQLRTNERHDYRTTVIVERLMSDAPAEPPLRRGFYVASRNVSRNGLGLVVPPPFVSRS